jgi:hypothetical protein
MAAALSDNTWIRDLDHLVGFTSAHHSEFITLWNRVEQVPLQPQQADKITWTLTKSGDYTTSSAYKAQFIDFAANHALAAIWKTWAPPNANSLCGSSSRTEFGPLTDWRGGTGTTTPCARCAKPPRRRHFTCLLSVDTRVEYGRLSPTGWVFTIYFPASGRRPLQRAIGG